MNKVSNLTSSNAISTCMSDESAHGYVFNRTLVCWFFSFLGALNNSPRLCELPVYLFLIACVSNLHKQKGL